MASKFLRMNSSIITESQKIKRVQYMTDNFGIEAFGIAEEYQIPDIQNSTWRIEKSETEWLISYKNGNGDPRDFQIRYQNSKIHNSGSHNNGLRFEKGQN